ncbi:MAG TPA: Uma2 family endonuclease [Candidatus Xenobia bacterium]|jgi:Uma2 family endonuclease
MTLSRHPTLEEFLQWPEEKPYREFIHGEVRQKTMGNFAHSFLQASLASRLDQWSGTRGWVMTEQRCILEAAGDSHVVLPDVAWWRMERLPSPPHGAIALSPDLAVEVLSPDDRFREVHDKVMVYLGAGVKVVWVVDPPGRQVTVYGPGLAPDAVKPPAALRDAYLPGLEISLADLFPRLPAKATLQPPVQDVTE